jgi:hypothetical protein
MVRFGIPVLPRRESLNTVAYHLYEESDMPDVLVEVRRGWFGSQKLRFLDAIHAAIVEALQTPKDDKVLRLTEHQPEQCDIPSSAGEECTHIELTMFVSAGPSRRSGRSTKRL